MYLVRVWAGARSTTTGQTFDQLRVQQYTSFRAGIYALPPTSSDTRGHLHRGGFLVNRACRLLATYIERDARLEPVEHWWEEHFGTMLQSKCTKSLPQNVVAIYAGVQASVTLNDVGAILLELHASYSAIERGIIRSVKTCQEKTNFPEHLLWRTVTNFVLLCFILSSATRFIPNPGVPPYPVQIMFKC